jgi:integrase
MSLSLSQLAEKFLAWSSVVHAPRTTEAYRHQLGKFIARHGRKPIARLRAIDLQECGCTWHLYQAVQRLFNWAKDDAKLAKENPFNKLRRPFINERKRVVSRLERVHLLRAARPQLRRLMLAYRETFARPQELRAATWQDLIVPGESMPLHEALPRGEALLVLWEHKTRKQRRDKNTPRVILLSPRVGRLLARLLRSSPRPGDSIFLSHMGKPWTANALRCCFRRLRRRLELRRDRHGENIVPYTWRHSGATSAAAAGIRDRVLAEILGHTSTRTTARYQHLDVNHLREALRGFWKRQDKPR